MEEGRKEAVVDKMMVEEGIEAEKKEGDVSEEESVRGVEESFEKMDLCDFNHGLDGASVGNSREVCAGTRIGGYGEENRNELAIGSGEGKVRSASGRLVDQKENIRMTPPPIGAPSIRSSEPSKRRNVLVIGRGRPSAL